MARRVPIAEDALIETYRSTIRPLYGWISRRVGGDAGLAEDLAQETWLRALDSWPSRGVPDEPLAWLLRVARNTLISHFRRVRPEPTDPGLIDLVADDHGGQVFGPGAVDTDTTERAAIVSWGIARLRRRHAEVLEAFYFDEKSVKEIARDQRTTERAIEGRLRRARARLKKKLERLIRPDAAPTRESESRMSHADTRTP